MTFDSDKNLAGIGAIIIAIGYLISIILTIVGFILLLLGVSKLANYYGEKSIFNNFLYGFIIALIGTVATILIGLAMVFAVYQTIISPSLIGSSFFFTTGGFLFLFVVLVIISAIFTLISVIFFRRGILILKEKSGIDLFGISATILLIGAILTFVLVGSVVLLAGWIVLGVAFFTMKPKEFSQVQQITSQQI